MLKVVIADDETRICQLIQALVDWDGLELTLAATASNGLEALEAVRREQPDILITDIRMPGCSGIELIEKAKAIMPEMEIVIISGYAHFEYAQTAMRFGVGDYLLKPVSREELDSTLRKLSQRCRERKQQLRYSREMEQKVSGIAAHMNKRLIRDLVEKKITLTDRETLAGSYQFPLTDGLLQVLYLKIDYDPDQFHQQFREIIRQQLSKITQDMLLPLCSNAAFYYHGPWAVAVVQFDRNREEEVRSCCRQMLNKLVAKRSFFGNIQFSLAMSCPIKRPEELAQAMEEAETTIQERLLEGTERLLKRAPVSHPCHSRDRLVDFYCRGLEELLQTQDLTQGDQLVTQLQQRAMEVPEIRGRDLMELVRACGELLLLRTGSSTGMEDFIDRCSQCSDAAMLFQCLGRQQRLRLQQLSEQRQTEQQRPIRIAKQFIQNHYRENIGLEEICAATGFSPSYFSVMFKKETGENISKYLTRVRMEKAKELLQESNASVAVICSEVGYSDLKHFNQTFKKATNLTPGQYRKLYG